MVRNKNRRVLGSCARVSVLLKQNIRFARTKWEISRDHVAMLEDLTAELDLSVAAGHLRLIDSNWYVTHAGLLRIAKRSHCFGIKTTLERPYSEPSENRWVFKATVYKSPRSRGFVGYGDADPSNVSSLVHGAEMRVAETRAVNRALRKAYGVGLCSVEELGWAPRSSKPTPAIRTDQHLRLPETTAITTVSLASATVCAC